MGVLGRDLASVQCRCRCVAHGALSRRRGLLLYDVSPIDEPIVHVVVLDALQRYPVVGARSALLLLLLQTGELVLRVLCGEAVLLSVVAPVRNLLMLAENVLGHDCLPRATPNDVVIVTLLELIRVLEGLDTRLVVRAGLLILGQLSCAVDARHCGG